MTLHGVVSPDRCFGQPWWGPLRETLCETAKIECGAGDEREQRGSDERLTDRRVNLPPSISFPLPNEEEQT